MRRIALIAVGFGLALTGAAAADGAASRAAAAGLAASGAAALHRHPPARMLVYAQEWSLWPSRTTVPAGRVTVQLLNRGQDAHDLRIRRVTRRGVMFGKTQGVSLTGSGKLRQATWRLRSGRYELYCSLAQHRRRGMHTRLVVR